MSNRRWQSVPAAVIVAGLALLVAYTLGDVLDAGTQRLPGRDSGNVYVWEVYTRSVFGRGLLPHWNPYHFAGTPHLSDPQTTVLYPPALLLRWLPPISFLGWMTALHVWLGGVGALFLGRALGLGWPAATAAALAATLGGSMGAWLYNGHLLLISCAAWLPWALAFAILSVRRDRLLPHPGLVLVLVLQFLTGYLQGSLYIVSTVSLYFVFAAVWPEHRVKGVPRARPLAQLAIAGILAAGLSAFQLWPAARLVAEAGRTAGVPYEIAADGGWTFGDLATVFLPFRGIEAQPPHRYLGDRVTYVGWLLACLIPFAFLDSSRRRITVFFASLGLGAVMLALAHQLPFYRVHYALLPGLRVPGRILFVATLSLAILGSIGLERFVGIVRRREWPQLVRGAAVTVVIVAAALIAGLSKTGSTGVPPAHAWPWLPFIAAGGLVIVAALSALAGVRPALLAGLTILAIDLTAFSAGAVQTVPIEPRDVIRRWMGSPSGGRAVSVCENRIGAGEMLLNNQPSLDGPAGIHLRDYADWAYLAKFGDPPAPDGLFRRVGSEGPLPARRDLLDLANVSVVFSCEPLDLAALTLVSHVYPVYAYRNESAWPRAFWTCATPELTRSEVVRELLRARYDGNQRLTRRHFIDVRWVPGLSDERRRVVEERHHLTDGVRREGSTWRYVLNDTSTPNALALIREAAVEDTEGVDHTTGSMVELAGRLMGSHTERGELLIGATQCAERAQVAVLVKDQPDGRVTLRVDAPAPGFVFLSEPYYSERRAFVDGEPVTSLKANLAFTAVPVPSGRHHVELRYVPRSFQLGLGVSVLTLLAWTGLSIRK